MLYSSNTNYRSNAEIFRGSTWACLYRKSSQSIIWVPWILKKMLKGQKSS